MVIDMQNYRREAPSPEKQACDQVVEQLRHKVTSTVLAQACARAARSMQAGRPMADAVRSACAWALCVRHHDSNDIPPSVA